MLNLVIVCLDTLCYVNWNFRFFLFWKVLFGNAMMLWTLIFFFLVFLGRNLIIKCLVSIPSLDLNLKPSFYNKDNDHWAKLTQWLALSHYLAIWVVKSVTYSRSYYILYFLIDTRHVGGLDSWSQHTTVMLERTYHQTVVGWLEPYPVHEDVTEDKRPMLPAYVG